MKRTILIAAFGAALTLCGISAASAMPMQDAQPRRVEVDQRLANQDLRIDRELRSGRIDFRQAAYLHREDAMIRGEERHDAMLHGGFLSPADQARLNFEENRVSGQIERAALHA